MDSHGPNISWNIIATYGTQANITITNKHPITVYFRYYDILLTYKNDQNKTSRTHPTQIKLIITTYKIHYREHNPKRSLFLSSYYTAKTTN
jgi:hypothetical protein